MRNLILIACLLCISFLGCSSKNITVVRDDVKVTVSVWSFFTESEIGDIVWDPNTGRFRMTEYKNSTSELVENLFKIGYEAGKNVL